MNYKTIDFPEEECQTLSKQDTVITHRVSDDFYKFELGDTVISKWGSQFKITELLKIKSIDDSPYVSSLTNEQYLFLSKFNDIVVLKLVKLEDQNLEFKGISENEVKNILTSISSYSNNQWLVLDNFYKYFDENSIQEKLWYGCFEGGNCMALALLKKNLPEGFILLAEFQSIVKGYGKPLLENILERSKNIWWCADPTGGDSLVEYYRRFGIEEHFIKLSKWTDTPEYAFFKVSDAQHREQILDTIAKADKTSEKYNPEILK